MKSRIFIGSSKEGLAVAQIVKEYFSSDYDCYLWSDDVFKENDSFLDTLLREASLFDFAFMIFSKDDKSEIRKELFDTPRDNVLFEFGLFIGRVGTDRAFVIREKGVKMPSDLFGITQSEYVTKEDGSRGVDKESLIDSLSKLKKVVDENSYRGHLSLLPSTVIALSYYNNFVKIIADSIFQNRHIIIKDKSYQIDKFIVKIPRIFEMDMKKTANVYYIENELNEIPITTPYRSYPVHYKINDEGRTELYDIPTILQGVYDAINMYFHTGYVGKAEEQKLTEEHEMQNFKKVLQFLIDNDACCKRCVVVD